MQVEEERFRPGDFTPPWVRYQHEARYLWAAQFVAGRRVLDAACGSGYGSVALADAGASKVDAFDCSSSAIREAAGRYQRPNLRFIVGSALRLPVPDRSYDVYVSFETIEHIADDRRFLAEAVRVLRPDGLLLLSTPNRRLLNPGRSLDSRPFNRFHVREYTRDDLADRLARHFGSVRWYGQRNYAPTYVSWLTAVGEVLPTAAVRLHQARKCLGWAWESPLDHVPKAVDGESRAEILVAACRVVPAAEDLTIG